MSDDTKNHEHEHDDAGHVHKNLDDTKFTCPSCGVIERDDVVFLCNKCKQTDMVRKNGLYMCPSCLSPGENFECMICESKEVIMELK